MFTGLVADLGEVRAANRSAEGARLVVQSVLASQLRPGDSVSVNGVCLTATDVEDSSFSAEAMNETLARTALAELTRGSAVNIELPLRAGEPLGGHVVQGHVDGIGTVVEVRDDGFARRVEIETGPEVLRYVVHKGSIAVDGVSLTVAEEGPASFTVSLIPETLQRTNLGRVSPGTKVNLEVDVLAKYVEKLFRSQV